MCCAPYELQFQHGIVMISAAVVTLGMVQKRNGVAAALLGMVIVAFFFFFSAFFESPPAPYQGRFLAFVTYATLAATLVSITLALWSLFRRPSWWDLTLLAPFFGLLAMYLTSGIS